MKTGFVYLWYDKKRQKYYLGSHLGNLNDGYTGSNKRFKSAYKNRPHSFKRRILEFYENISSKELRIREQYWLNLIKPEELTNRYYNEKKLASGGDIISNLSEEKRRNHAKKSSLNSKKYWDNITTDEYKKRQKNAFGGNNFDRQYLIERNKKLCSKRALVKYPNGFEEEIINVSEFCQKNNLNYQNFKTVLRSNGKRKSCKGFSGVYL